MLQNGMNSFIGYGIYEGVRIRQPSRTGYFRNSLMAVRTCHRIPDAKATKDFKMQEIQNFEERQ